MKKLLALLITSILFASVAGKTEPQTGVAPCADHGMDSKKRYLGGRVINAATGAAWANAQVQFTNGKNTDEPNIYYTRTNAQGEYWFCGKGTNSDDVVLERWLVIVAENSIVKKPLGAVYGLFPTTRDGGRGTPDSYTLDFELAPTN